jgi:hypothetical protein
LNSDQGNSAVLFSGGRDSTLAACREIITRSPATVLLVRCRSGFSVGPDLAQVRLQELRQRFAEVDIQDRIIDITGLVRLIAILNIEQDFAMYRHNLILLGEALAMYAGAIVACHKAELSRLVTGSSGYQAHFTEQMSQVLDWFSEFALRYGITCIHPLRAIDSEETVKHELRLLGVSPKSLESSTMFAESFTTPDVDVAISFLEAKKKTAEQFVSFLTQGG